MRSLRIFGLLALIGTAAGCGGGGGGGSTPEPGLLTLTLNTPNADDGALLFKVVGGQVDSVLGSAMIQDGSYTIQPSYTRIVVAGNIVDGVVARVAVPDINDAASYSVVMEQVAVRNSFAQRSLTGYSIAVSAP
ncbi:MAG TPA: hypothetical protein VG940_13445 [Gemmatimonadales bacterium]|nr:hypothetical protein [Gemmatimonadales bacterium]